MKPYNSGGRTLAVALLAAAVGGGIGWSAQAQQQPSLGYSDTPLLPGGKWHVHDGERPQPRIVEPGTASTQEQPGRPPADALVLFDGKDLSQWKDGKGNPAGWTVENGEMRVPRRGTPGAGSIATREQFGDCQLHIEFATPNPPRGEGQNRGNSGVMFLDGRYEIQVLDSYGNKTYPDGQASAVYGQYPPRVNASRKPGEWQTYDILFTAPRFKGDQVESPAYVTVFHNGIAVHDHAQILGIVGHKVAPIYKAHPEKGSLVLQDHGQPVRFRNIWIRELKGYDQQ